MLKKVGALFLFVAVLSGFLIFNFNSSKEHVSQGIKGSKQYWQDRIGVFNSSDDYSKIVEVARKKISKSPSKRALGIDWKELGPDNIGGRTRAFLIDDANPSLLFAGGVSGGLWFSTNGGQSWGQTTPGDVEDYLTITSITQDDQGYIYYGTGEGLFYGAPGVGSFGFIGKGIYRSKTPHGTDFEHLNGSWSVLNKSNFISVNAMASDDKGNVYAACLNKLYRSTDRGITWSIVSSMGSVPIFGAGWDVAVTPNGFVIVALGTKVYTSPSGNSGSFSAVPSSELPLFSGRITLAIAPSDDNTIYISSATSGAELDAIYQSKDQGATWLKIISGGSSLFAPFTGGGPQGEYDQCISVYPDNPNRILLGGIELYRWEEGENWEKLSQFNAGRNDHNYIHADKHTIRFDAINPDLFYVGTDGGVFRTMDDGKIFEQLNRGYAVTQLYGLAFGADGVVLGGTQDNSNVYIDGLGNTEKSADLHSSGDGGWSAISQLLPDAFFIESQYGRIRRNNTRSSTYVEFFKHDDASLEDPNADYDYKWNEFVSPFILWESKDDLIVPDSINYTAGINYNVGEKVSVPSGVPNVDFNYTLSAPLSQAETITLKNPIQSLLVYPSFEAVWITREALDFSIVPSWIKLTNVGLSKNYYIGASALAVSKDGDDIFYGTELGEIYRASNVSQVIDDATAASNVVVTKIASLKTKFGGNAFVTSISIDPNDKDHVIVTVGYYDENVNVYVSTSAATTNSTESFTSIQGDLPNFPVYGSLIEYYSEAYVVGTEYGVYTSTNNGINWSREVDVPYCPSIMISQQTWNGSQNFGQIYVATHGRGVFTSEHYVGSDEVKVDGVIPETIKVFPNPVLNDFKVETASKIDGSFLVSVYSIDGKLVEKKEVQFSNGISNLIDASSLSKGRYLVLINLKTKIYRGNLLKR
jgi:hypothetical protein